MTIVISTHQDIFASNGYSVTLNMLCRIVVVPTQQHHGWHAQENDENVLCKQTGDSYRWQKGLIINGNCATGCHSESIIGSKEIPRTPSVNLTVYTTSNILICLLFIVYYLHIRQAFVLVCKHVFYLWTWCILSTFFIHSLCSCTCNVRSDSVTVIITWGMYLGKLAQ